MSKKTYPTLATADEIRRIAARAHKILDKLSDSIDDTYDPETRSQTYEVERGAKEALRFCAAAAVLLRDVSLMPVVVRALEIQEFWNDEADMDTSVVAHGVSSLLEAGASVTPAIERLATHDDQRLRAAVAAGLQPTDDSSLALLEQLGRDPIYEVRRPAQATLAKVREVPWWMGKFQSDPLERLEPDQIARHKPTLDQLDTVLDVPRYNLFHRQDEIVSLAETLPDELAVDLAVTSLSARGFDKPQSKLGTMMVTRKGGAQGLIQLCEIWSKQPYSFYGDARVEIVSSAPPDVRLATCMALARYACSRSLEERRQQGGAADIAATIAGKAFPPDADLGPLLELLLSMPPVESSTYDKIDWALNGLSQAFGTDKAQPGSIADQLIEARLEGYPGVWKSLRHAADKLVGKIPREILRPAAERSLHHLDDDTVRWAIQCLIREAHDPSCDPEPHDLIARMCEDDPRLRRIILKSIDLRKLALPWLRTSLRQDALTFEEAAAAINVVDGFWTSMDPSPFLGALGRDDLLEDNRRKERELYATMLASGDFSGPVSDEEWAALRRIRDRHTSSKLWRSALLVLPKGPWQPEDREFFDQVVARCEAGKVELAVPIAHVLASKCTLDDLPLFDKLIALVPEHKSFIRRCQYDARVGLGLPARPESKRAAGAKQTQAKKTESEKVDPSPRGKPRLFLVPESMDEPNDENH